MHSTSRGHRSVPRSWAQPPVQGGIPNGYGQRLGGHRSIGARTRRADDVPTHCLEGAPRSASRRIDGSRAGGRSRRPVVAARPSEDLGERSVGEPLGAPRANIPMLLTVRQRDVQFVPLDLAELLAVERASVQDDDLWAVSSGLTCAHWHILPQLWPRDRGHAPKSERSEDTTAQEILVHLFLSQFRVWIQRARQQHGQESGISSGTT